MIIWMSRTISPYNENDGLFDYVTCLVSLHSIKISVERVEGTSTHFNAFNAARLFFWFYIEDVHLHSVY